MSTTSRGFKLFLNLKKTGKSSDFEHLPCHERTGEHSTWKRETCFSTVRSTSTFSSLISLVFTSDPERMWRPLSPEESWRRADYDAGIRKISAAGERRKNVDPHAEGS